MTRSNSKKMKLKTKLALWTATAAAGAAFLSGGTIGASASQPEKPQTATVDSSQQKKAVWLIGCLSYGDNSSCGAAKFDKTVAQMKKTTRTDPEVVRTCKKKAKSAWYTGYCAMIEDDESKLTLRMSDLGMIARTRLAIK
jgi:hypothetical protein